MLNNFLKFLEVIEEEIELYKKLYVLLENESKYITDFNRDALALNNSKKQYLLQKLARMYEKRELYVSQISKHNPGQTLSLKNLKDLAPVELKKRFDNCHQNFVEMVRQVREKNTYNREYIAMSLKRLKMIINNLNKYLNIESTYNEKGIVKDNGMSSLMKEA